MTTGTPELDAFVHGLSATLGDIARRSKGKVILEVVHATTDAQRAIAKEEGLSETIFGESSPAGGDQVTLTRGYMGISLKYGDERETIPILSPDQKIGVQLWVINKIRELQARLHDLSARFGVITGKGEIKLTDTNLTGLTNGRPGPSMKGVLEQSLPFYKFEDVDLRGGDAAIDPSLVGLIITQPDKDFVEKELRRIDEFLMRGDRSLAVFAGAVSMKAHDPEMKAALSTHGLERLLDGYGVEMKKDAVLDWGRSLSIPVTLQSGQVIHYQLPSLMQAQHDPQLDARDQTLDASFGGFFRIDEVSLPFPSTLVAHPDRQPEATVRVVARSTPKATVDTSETIDMKIRPEWTVKGGHGQRALAIAVEGRLRSAFVGKGAAPGIEAPAASGGKGRVLVIAASQFLTNPFARAGNPPPAGPAIPGAPASSAGDEDLQMLAAAYAQKYLVSTILVFKNTLDWMGDDNDSYACSATPLSRP